MFDFKQSIAELLDQHIEGMTQDEIYQTIEFPKHVEMGDFAFPCFKLAKIFRKAPPMIAKELVDGIALPETFSKLDAVGGYLNFTVNPTFFAKTVIEAVQEQGEQYGASNVGEGKKVIVEYSSTNIAKPFHMGHIRSTMIGYSIYKIFTFLGYDTVGINHLGDYGTQFGKLIVAYKLWGDRDAIEANPIPELLKIYVKFHDEAKEKPELEDEARAWFTKLENKDEEAFELWTWFREVSLKEFNRVYGKLGVKFDSYAGESFYSDKMPAVLDELRQKNICEKDQGAEIVRLDEYKMPNALVTKSDGSSLYLTRDIAAAIYRKEHYDFVQNIYVVGASQQLHFKQWMKVLELMGRDYAKDCHHIEFGMVGLEEGSLSTRNGRVVFLEDVLDKASERILEIIKEKNPNLENKETVAKQVGVGAVVFQELSNNRIKDYTFSLERTLSFEGETGPYVQYAHARAMSMLTKFDVDINVTASDYSSLSDEASLDVVRLISKFPQVVQDAAAKYEPSLITRHVTQIASAFNRFYNANHIKGVDEATKMARLSLVAATARVIKTGLNLICVEAPERM